MFLYCCREISMDRVRVKEIGTHSSLLCSPKRMVLPSSQKSYNDRTELSMGPTATSIFRFLQGSVQFSSNAHIFLSLVLWCF